MDLYGWAVVLVGKLTLWAAILIDLGSLLAVILNGMRLLTSTVYEPRRRSMFDLNYSALDTSAPPVEAAATVTASVTVVAGKEEHSSQIALTAV